VRRDSVISDIEANRPKITVCEKFSLQDNSANPRLNAVTPRTELHVEGDNAELDAALDFIPHAKPCPLRRVSTHRSTRQDAQINYLSTLSIFMKQTTYLATLPNPSCSSLNQNRRSFIPWHSDRPIQPSHTLPTLAPIQQRRRELPAYRAPPGGPACTRHTQRTSLGRRHSRTAAGRGRSESL
jgi:hypothetical protein